MKCPKCQYIGFDNGERCRNCGYEFSLSVEETALDLPIQTGAEPEGPLADFSLADLDRPLAAPPPAAAPAAVRAPVESAGGSAERRVVAAPKRATTSGFDLPLFRDRPIDDDTPLVAPPAVPRAPLSVRRAAPAAPRAKSPDDAPQPAAAGRPVVARRVPPPAAAEQAPAAPLAPDTAGALPRLLAAAIDALILGSLTAVVLHFTLQLTRLEFADIGLLPKLPLITYLLLLNGGYCVVFTAAGGQTIGKMATGIRVVPADPEGRAFARVPVGHAVLRVAGYALSLLTAGLGYLPALVGRDRRALHDRLADTRVVKL